MFRSLLVLCAVAVCLTGQTIAPPDHVDVVYATVDGVDLKLDIYLPVSPGPFPAVIWLHGGSWNLGDKFLAGFDAQRLRAAGIATIAVNYRLSTTAPWPAQVHDAKAAVRFIRSNAATFQIDPNHIGAYGFSAGAQIAGVLGTSGNSSSIEGTVGDCLSQSSAVQCVAAFAGPFDLITLGDEDPEQKTDIAMLLGFDPWGSAPMGQPEALLLATTNASLYVDSDDPPHFLSHGELDQFVALHQSTDYYTTLTAAGVESELFIAFGEVHFESQDALAHRDFFFLRHLAPPQATSTARVVVPQPIFMDQTSTVSIVNGAPYASFILGLASYPAYYPLGTFGDLGIEPITAVPIVIDYLDANGRYDISYYPPFFSGFVYLPLYFQAFVETSALSGDYVLTRTVSTHFAVL